MMAAADDGDSSGDPDEDWGTDSPTTGFYDDVIVGPPELINPNPTLNGERAGARQ